MKAASSGPRPSGKVIKTLRNIRYIRPQPPASPQNPVVKSKEQVSETYVQKQHKPAVRVQPPAPPPARPRRNPVTPAPEATMLFDWFHTERPHLPNHPFALTPWQRIINPQRFYEAIARHIAAYPAGPRAHVITEDLAHLRAYVRGRSYHDPTHEGGK